MIFPLVLRIMTEYKEEVPTMFISSKELQNAYDGATDGEDTVICLYAEMLALREFIDRVLAKYHAQAYK